MLARAARSLLSRSTSAVSSSRSSALLRTATPCCTTAIMQQQRSLATGGQQLASMTAENPHIDVVKYAHKNRTWTLNHVEYYSTALAIGLAENGLQPGDAVLSWLPLHFSEQMVLQFACSKAGMVLYSLDPALAVKDPVASKKALEAALELTKANVLLSQEAGSDVNYVRLAAEVIPELRIFDFAKGVPFVTPRFPHLRFPIHTGFDQDDKAGWLLLRHMIVPSNNLDTHMVGSSVTDSTPLAGELVLDKAGVPVKLGKTLTNKQVVEKKLWPTYVSVLEKKYHEVDGIGVIF